MEQNIYEVYQSKGSVYFNCDSCLCLKFKGKNYSHVLEIMSVEDKDFHKQFVPLYLFFNPKFPHRAPIFMSIGDFTPHYRASFANVAKASLFRTWMKIRECSSPSKNKWDAIITIKHNAISYGVYGWLTIYPKDNHQGFNFHIPLAQLSFNIYGSPTLHYVRGDNPSLPTFSCSCVSVQSFLNQLIYDGRELPKAKAEKALLKCKDSQLYN